MVINDQDYATFCGRIWHPAIDAVTRRSVIGMAPCTSLVSNRACEKYEVRIDLSYIDGAALDQRRSLLCHEIGHTVGLAHTGVPLGTCMLDNVPNEGASTGIDEHDLWMINDGPWALRAGASSVPSTRGENEFMSSPNGDFKLWLQSDGHLVLYNAAGQPVWSTGLTNGYSNWVAMQGDGNFVQYATDGWGTWPVCSTHTHVPNSTTTNYYMKLQDDGNMVLVAPGDRVLWSRFGGGRCT